MFAVECSTSVAREGRSQLASGLQFFRHPESSFQTIGRSSAQSTPTLTHSTKRSTTSTRLDTPLGSFKDDSSVSRPVHAHQSTRRLSQFQLSNVADQAASETSSPSQSTFLGKVLHPVPELDTSDPSKDAPLDISKVPDVVESISQQLPFQLVGMVESMLGSKPPPPSIVQSAPVSAMQSLRVIKYLRPGYLWDFWLGKHSQYGEVVVKLVYLPDYPCNNPEFDDYVPDEQVVKEALKEEDTYLGPLADLQGEVVPRYYGMYHSVPDGEHIAIMLEYIEQPTGGEPRLAEEERKHRLYSAYERLHFRGVLHRDIDFRHILMNKRDMTFRLVSFRRSCRKSLKNEDDVASLMSEYVVVRVSIGWERDEDIANEDIPSSYTSRLADPAAFLAELQAAHEVPLDDWIVEHNRKLSEGISTF
ncbi:hypothetical protein V865_006019 [Kwoniella europaea PYCC6329]|uniref:Protein kinase domain-containing protein n=1 Tax=Kwoniella europaea PYCC6329 TaxID=1423913 RepID=A0AAX4KQ35_9TREE